ncbi:MAG: hypothetical protein ACOH1O_14145 [Flavobacterium sp.]
MKLELNTELKLEIDTILSELFNGDSVSEHKDISDLRSKAILTSKSLMLIKKSSNLNRIELDEKGILAINDGGIENYLSKYSSDKDLDSIIKKLTSKRLKYDIFYNLSYVIFGAILTNIPALIKYINSIFTKF